MRVEKIRSKNAAYQKFEVLKTNRNKRYRYGEFFVEGVRNLNQAVKNGWQASAFLYAGGKTLSSWAKEMLDSVPADIYCELSADLMAELSGKEDTSELMAVFQMRKDSLDALRLSPVPLIALFDRPSNRGNLGTILRSCDALGVEALLITGHAVDLYDPEVIVASMGSFFNVPTVRVTDGEAFSAYLDQMRARYPLFQVVGTTAHREHPIADVDLTRPSLIMIGNETEGLCRAFKESSDVLATIPMAETSSASSFNVACAATVLFYEAVRQRNSEKRSGPPCTQG